MPRLPRTLGDDLHYHVVLQCNNKERLLSHKEFELLHTLLAEYKEKFHYRLYDYVFMQTHTHLLLSTHGGHSLDILMHEFCLAFAKEYNRYYRRTGHVWRNRYWCRVIGDDRYGLACLRYFAWNAPKGGLAASPADWPWCGYQFYAFGSPNAVLEPHPSYIGLADDRMKRQAYYRDLVATPLLPEEEQLFKKRCRISSHRAQQWLAHFTRYLVPCDGKYQVPSE